MNKIETEDIRCIQQEMDEEREEIRAKRERKAKSGMGGRGRDMLPHSHVAANFS